MVRTARVLLTLIVFVAVLGLLPTQSMVHAVELRQPIFTGYAAIEGPVKLEVSASPPTVQPGDTLSLRVLLTNSLPAAAAPQVILRLPSSLSLVDNKFAAGVSFNYQANELSWLPLLNPGTPQELNLNLRANVADLTQPQHEITAQLHHGQSVQSASVPIWIGLPATVRVSVEPQIAAVGQPIQFQAVTEGTGPFSQSWDFGDGRHITTPNPQIVFPVTGTYQVTVTLANPLGVAQATTLVSVIPEPKAAFSVDDELAVPMESVLFTNQSGGEGPLAFLWDFGDGTTSSERHPVHFFPATGYYRVRLLVQSARGQAETERTMIVGNGPGADFLIDAQGVTGSPIVAQAVVDATVTDIRWDMGDGVTYSGRDISHTYDRVGTYNVTFTAGNEYGEAVITKPIVIDAGTFSYYVPFAVYPVGPPAATSPAIPGAVTSVPILELPGRTPPLAGEFAPNPGGAGPALDALPDTVMLQATSVPPAGSVDVPSPVALPPSVPLIKLPERSPLAPSASPAEGLLWYVNEARRLHQLPPLTYNYQLSIAAQVHSEDMAAVSGVMHVGSDGSRPADRQVRFGFDGYYAGEAVAWGWESSVPVVEFWVNSPPHRVLLLNPNATHVGVGFYADGTTENIWYWAAEFGLKLDPFNPLQPPLPW